MTDLRTELEGLIAEWRTRVPSDSPATSRVLMREWCADKLEALIRTHGRALTGALEDAASYRTLCDGVGADMVKRASEKFGDALCVMRDAERYRWLRSNAVRRGDKLDNTIDAAMSQHTARDGGGEGK